MAILHSSEGTLELRCGGNVTMERQSLELYTKAIITIKNFQQDGIGIMMNILQVLGLPFNVLITQLN